MLGRRTAPATCSSMGAVADEERCAGFGTPLNQGGKAVRKRHLARIEQTLGPFVGGNARERFRCLSCDISNDGKHFVLCHANVVGEGGPVFTPHSIDAVMRADPHGELRSVHTYPAWGQVAGFAREVREG